MTVGTVTGAADMLHTSQSAVSRSLQRLETVLDLRLFKREKGRLVPTGNGQAFFNEVKKAFLGLDRLEHVAIQLRSNQTGSIGIACAPVFSIQFIAEAVRRFNVRHPDVSVSIDTQQSHTIAEMMTAQRFDLGLVGYALTPPGVESRIFAEPEEVCVLPPNHPLVHKEVLTPEDLAPYRWIFLAGNDASRYRLDKLFENAGIYRMIETHYSSTLCALVARGLGLAIINPFTAVEYLGQGLVLRRFSEHMPFSTSLLRALYRPESALVNLFIEDLMATRDMYLAAVSDALGQPVTAPSDLPSRSA